MKPLARLGFVVKYSTAMQRDECVDVAKVSREEKVAVLLLPVATILEEGDPFIWDMSWRRSKQ
mgnify:CR=1 FL=1